ncbi:DUF1850 domain-containing protein [Fictibacillus arsenicus]|uniref:DUF1850 domain-containing protein n=1 Tax=Fictibacillus arsenicus TaxID=255247 RepID=UPI001558F1D3|nr:DUF1850 domain-containing protein [Fictibacillus arsenicus]
MIVSVLAAASLYPAFLGLIIEDGETGEWLAFMDIKPGEEFSIKYIHSIHRTPVLETYLTNEEGIIIQTEMRFEEFGVGMPSGATGTEVFTQKNGTYILSNMNRTFPLLDIRTGQIIANHTLLYDGHEYPFSSFSEKGSWVRIKTEKISVWQWFIGGKKLG